MGNVFKQRYTKPIPEGAELFIRKGQGYARWTDARGKRQTAKLTEKGDRIQRESIKYYCRYRDGSGVVQTVPTGCRSRDAASAVLAELVARSENVKAGIRTAAEDSTIDHQATPIGNHIQNYVDDLRQRRGRGGKPQISASHTAKTENHLIRISAACKFQHLRDLNGDTIGRWCRQQREQQDAPSESTLNDYLGTWTSFGNWLADKSRLVSNPFGRLISKYGGDEDADRRRERRALTTDELRRLLVAARLRPLAEYGRERTPRDGADQRENKRSRRTWTKTPLTFESLHDAAERGRNALRKQPSMIADLEITGYERALLYKLLTLTGLRKSEAASLTVGQLELEGPRAYARLKAADSKAGQAADVPLKDELAADLRQWLANRLKRLRDDARASGDAIPAALPRDMPVLNVPDGLIRIFDKDLAAAGIAKRDERGRTADVHALRFTFASHLSAGNVAPRTAQAAMRHSTIELTMKTYTDPQLLDVHGAMDVLPDMPLNSSAESEHHRATGTDDETALTSLLTSDLGNRGISLSIADQASEKGGNSVAGEVCVDSPESLVFMAKREVETMEHTGLEPVTSALQRQRSPN